MKSFDNVIDCHVHITESGKWYNTTYDASVECLLRQMDKAGVSKSVLLPIHGATSNSFIKKICSEHKDRFIGFGSISAKSWKEDVQQILDYNLKGVKFHPRIQNESIAEWEQMGILSELQERGLPIVICGWQQTSSLVANMNNIQPLIIDDIAKRYKELKIVIAHMGGHKFYDAFFCARGNANVYLDCSYFFSFFKGTSLEKDALVLFKKIDEKILFGSDFPEISIPEYVSYFSEQSEKYQLDFSKMMSNNIYKLIADE